MLFEASTIASALNLFIEGLEKHYNLDPRAVFAEIGLDLSKLHIPGARYPDSLFDQCFHVMLERTGDPCMGLVLGQHVRPTTFHALGFAWLASATLRGAFQRLVRFDNIVSTGEHLEKHNENGHCHLTLESTAEPGQMLPQAVDAYFAAILKMSRMLTDSSLCPAEVRLGHPDYGRGGDYVTAFDAPVIFDTDQHQIIFDAEVVDAPLTGADAELALVNDQVAEKYLETLHPEALSHQVRELLVKLLPSGNASQERVARRMARSLSSLQRQLRSEGTSFKALRDETRRELAIGYIREGEMSLGEVAFLTGFGDQSSFSRAFRRWTGFSPKQYEGAAGTSTGLGESDDRH